MTAPTPRWATKREAAAYARISIATLDRWLTGKRIARHGQDRHIRVDLNEIDTYLSNTHKEAS